MSAALDQQLLLGPSRLRGDTCSCHFCSRYGYCGLSAARSTPRISTTTAATAAALQATFPLRQEGLTEEDGPFIKTSCSWRSTITIEVNVSLRETQCIINIIFVFLCVSLLEETRRG